VVLELLAAGVVVASLAVLAWWRWVRWRRSDLQACVTEAEARENAAPLTKAIVSGRGDRDRTGL
jgi:hypothetical protein